MKRLLMALACLAVCGCSSNAHKQVLYVRDPSHHCQFEHHRPARKGWDYYKSEVVTVPGFNVWYCDDDLYFSFDDGKEQP
jgi:hypothetical protein